MRARDGGAGALGESGDELRTQGGRKKPESGFPGNAGTNQHLDAVSRGVDRLEVAVFHPRGDDDEMSRGEHDRGMVSEFVAEFAANAVEKLDLFVNMPERTGRREGLEVPDSCEPSESERFVTEVGGLLPVRIFRHAWDDSKRFRNSP